VYTRVFNINKVYDGSSPIQIDLTNDNTSIQCDEEGTPYPSSFPTYSQATLYKGINPITDESEYPYLLRKDVLHFVTNEAQLFDPMLGDFYPFDARAVKWSLENAPNGVTIDNNGLITVKGGNYNDANEITVKAVYRQNTYTTVMNITKVYDGTAPVAMDFTVDNLSIRCDEDGNPYDLNFPITSQALLYKGTTPASNVAWFIVENIYQPLGGPKWISISPNGLITILKSFDLSDNTAITIKAVYKGEEYTKVLSINKAYDGQSPTYIDFDDQNLSITCSWQGTPYELPIIIQADLIRGSKTITGIIENAITFYPSNIYFDPMLGSFYPPASSVVWSLVNAPPGVTIDQLGKITVGTGAVLLIENSITVRAVWRGETYTNTLRLVKVLGGKDGNDGQPGQSIVGPQGPASPRYRGKTDIPGYATGLVDIWDSVNSDGSHHYTSTQMNINDWVAYVGETISAVGTSWVKGECLKWNGASWERMPIKADGTFDTNPYVAALMDLTEGAPNAQFMSILVRDLIAKTAMIEQIFTHKMHLQPIGNVPGAIYGGGYDANGNPLGGDGVYLDSTGKFKAVNGDFTGMVTATDGEFNGSVYATGGDFDNITIKGNSEFLGNIASGPLVLSNDTPAGQPQNYPAGSGVATMYSSIYNSFVIGSYNGQNVTRIRKETSGNGMYRRIYIIYENGNEQKIAESANIMGTWVNTTVLSYDLTFYYVTSGKTFRLINLPTIPAGLLTGTVYIGANNILMVAQ
jgi:hypothetical protein